MREFHRGPYETRGRARRDAGRDPRPAARRLGQRVREGRPPGRRLGRGRRGRGARARATARSRGPASRSPPSAARSRRAEAEAALTGERRRPDALFAHARRARRRGVRAGDRPARNGRVQAARRRRPGGARAARAPPRAQFKRRRCDMATAIAASTGWSVGLVLGIVVIAGRGGDRHRDRAAGPADRAGRRAPPCEGVDAVRGADRCARRDRADQRLRRPDPALGARAAEGGGGQVSNDATTLDHRARDRPRRGA